jgi:hypothetical protein
MMKNQDKIRSGIPKPDSAKPDHALNALAIRMTISKAQGVGVRPCFVMARAVGETIAIRLGLVQRAACGEQPNAEHSFRENGG